MADKITSNASNAAIAHPVKSKIFWVQFTGW